MRDKDVIISVNSVSKKFCKDLKRSLYYGVKDIMKLGQGNTDNLRKGEFWAVSDVSFELKRGDFLGLIGHNGAGKSTLLKMLNGLISPDKGSITIHGRVGALIELGAGFNPILTGRENIFNNGAILGFSKKQMQAKMQEIIDFSEIEEFIDMPVQNYSSGMKVRLGFAVAANLEPDLLLIDEVLAVGDVGFRNKCYNKIASLMQSSAIILVSHSMPQIAKISSRILLMEKGKVKVEGAEVSIGIEAYLDVFEGGKLNIMGDGISLKRALFNAKESNEVLMLEYGEALDVQMDFQANVDVEFMMIVLVIFDKELKPICNVFSDKYTVKKEEQYQIHMRTEDMMFSPGTYSASVGFRKYDDKGVCTERLTVIENLLDFKVIGGQHLITPAGVHRQGAWRLENVNASVKEVNEKEGHE
jgi:lipopolysaccharide transport system ATP-binding protein